MPDLLRRVHLLACTCVVRLHAGHGLVRCDAVRYSATRGGNWPARCRSIHLLACMEPRSRLVAPLTSIGICLVAPALVCSTCTRRPPATLTSPSSAHVPLARLQYLHQEHSYNSILVWKNESDPLGVRIPGTMNLGPITVEKTGGCSTSSIDSSSSCCSCCLHVQGAGEEKGASRSTCRPSACSLRSVC